MKNRALVESLVNTAKPQVRPDLAVRETGCGEATVRQRTHRRYALISAAGVPVVELLDGSHTLNEVAGEVLRRRGRVRHQVILDTVVRLHAAGLLEPLEPELEQYLSRQARTGQAPRLVRFVRRLANLQSHLPVAWRAHSDRPIPEKNRRLLAVTALLLAAVSVVWTAASLWRHVATDGAFGPDVLGGMMLAAGGVCAAASWRAALRGALLRLLGRDVLGWGVSITAGIPHLSVDARDERMLDRLERIRYRTKNLLGLLVPGAGLLAWAGFDSGPLAWPLALGWQALLFAQLSPLWHGDLTHLLEELLGHRHLGRAARVFVVKKLWRHLWRLKRFDGEDLGLVLFATLGLAYAFTAVAALGLVVPGTLDGLTTAILEPGHTLGERLLAAFVCLYLAGALLLVALAILGTIIGALRQLLTARRVAAKPAEVIDSGTLELADLAEELAAIPPFSDMPRSLVEETLSQGRIERFAPGSMILRQGDTGDTCYVIRGGLCEVTVEDAAGRIVDRARLGPGHLFGEVALLEKVPRTATVTAVDEVELVALSGPAFLAMVAKSDVPAEAITEQLRIHLFLQKVELFRGLRAQGMRKLLKAVHVHRPVAGEVVVRQGDEGYSMFLIFRGRFSVEADGEKVATLGPGQYFGEIALVTGAVRTATVTCREAGVVVEVPAATYLDVIVQEFAAGVLLDREVNARLEELDLVN